MPVIAAADESADLEPDIVVLSAVDEIGLVTAAAKARAVRSTPVLAEIPLGTSTAAELERLLRRLVGQVDGVVLVPGNVLAAVEVLAEALPLLTVGGLVHRPGAGQTLRDRFGLDRPVSRFAETREAVRA